MTKTYRTLAGHSVIGTIFLLSLAASAGTISVPAGGDLQGALNSAQAGDVIALEAGATFAGPFTLPVKAGADWITIRSDAPDSALPAPGNRIDPSLGNLMPKLISASSAVIQAAPGAHHFRFVGVEFKPTPGTFLYNLVLLGDGSESSTGMLSHDIAFERCYLHGDPSVGSRRGIAMNAQNVTVTDSYLADFKEIGGDSEAIAGWNGTGPFRIVNNHLEASGVNVLFGGADAAIPNLVPSDILIANNHFIKPLAWKVGHPSYQGTHWRIKNLLELKNAQRVTIEHNFFEQNWADGQNGFAILFTVRNQDGSSPWSVVQNVVFQNNILRRTGSGINILGRDNNSPSQQTNDIQIRNNLLYEIGGDWGGTGRFLQLLEGAANVVVDQNTVLQSGDIIFAEGAPNAGFVLTNNITLSNASGIGGTGTSPGSNTLGTYFPGAAVAKNVIVGGSASNYSSPNYFPGSLDLVGFADPNGGNYRLGDNSPYRSGGTTGKDVGVDVNALSDPVAAANGNAPLSQPPADPVSGSGGTP